MEKAADRHTIDVTSAALKWVAAVTMVIDHIGAVILEWALIESAVPWDHNFWAIVDLLLRAIGRSSFPIFIFLMVEALYYTKSRKKYLERLLVFCLISEVPFDLAIGYTNTWEADFVTNFFVPQYQNVFFTLACGFAAIWLIEEIYKSEKLPFPIELLSYALIIAFFTAAAAFLKTDYGAGGVLAIIAGYFAKRFGLKPVFCGIVIIGVLTVLSSELEVWAAVIVLPLLAFYHGTKGRRGSRWIFYIFYPAQFALLAVVRNTLIALGII